MPETDDASIDTSVTTAEDPFIILAITDRSRAIGDNNNLESKDSYI